MCFPKVEYTAPSPPVQPADITGTKDVLKAEDNERKKAAAAFGYQSTIATSPQGVSGAAPTTRKTLLGS